MKKVETSIFDNSDVSASQEEFLQQCRFAGQGTPPDSPPVIGFSPPVDVPSVGVPPPLNDDPVDPVSPLQSTDTVDSEENDSDRTVVMDPEEYADLTVSEDRTAPVESEIGNRGGKRLGSTVKGDGGKKLKIPLREVVKAIVMNSRKTDKEKEKMSCVQVLVQKGFKFPGNTQNGNPSNS